MRKKFIKSSRPTYKKRIKKAQQGMRFVSYNPVSNPTIDYTDITNPINPFSEYNYNTVYNTPEALVVPVRDTNETDVVANNPTVEPVINKPVASKPVTDKPVTANSTWKSPYTNRRQWTTELINAYKKAGITNDNAIRMLLAQDALESSWGKSAQGKYNFGNLTTGSSWKGDYVTGNDKNAKGEAIKQKFRSYNSMDEYAADKVQFLKRLYDFDENDDINKFVAKLTGSNKGKRRYAEATNYAKVLTGVYNGIPKGENGMIIKYQEPAHGIARRDAFEGQDNKAQRQRLYRTVNPADGFGLGSKASNGWRYMWNIQREEFGTPHDEALWKGYLNLEKDSTQLPPTNIRFSRDYDVTGKPIKTKEYVGLPKQQKDAIRNKVIPRVRYKTPAGKWAQVYENPLKQFFDHPIETVIHKGDVVDTPDLSGLANFGLRNNNDSGIYDVADTYDFYTKPNQNGGRSFIPNRNKGYELEIRDTIWTKDAKPELYKVESGYLPYNADALTKKVYSNWLNSFNQKN